MTKSRGAAARRRERRGNVPTDNVRVQQHRAIIKTIRGQRRVVGCLCGAWPCAEYRAQAIKQAERRAAKDDLKKQLTRVDFQQSRREYAANKRRFKTS